MTFFPEDKNVSSKVKAAEKKTAQDYCKERGYTEEETKIFVENFLRRLYAEEHS